MVLSSFIYALIAGILPSFIWMWFWLREDDHPEPRWLLTATFIGGIIAVIFALFIEGFIMKEISNLSLRYTLWAATEEILKFIAVYFIAIKSKYNNEPLSAMVYCIIVSLGFAALENALFLITPMSQGFIAQTISIGNMRFIGATLVHIVSSATVGFALGYVFYRGIFAKISATIIGLSAAITLHTAFNLSIINADNSDTLKIFGLVWLAVIILIILFEEIKAVHPKYYKKNYSTN